ncbi:recombinase [Candidatus Amesbacteria bacterium]|nr:recombinase [Candidatus Amesbacteria bacterium]
MNISNGHSKKTFEIIPPTFVIKRDGTQSSYSFEKIETAIVKCFATLEILPKITAYELAKQVENILASKKKAPNIEEIQDLVETVLQASGEFEAAKHYILYRAEHAKLREVRPVPDEIKKVFERSDVYFPTQLQKFQFFDKYSRFNYDLGRRETWAETVDRAVKFLYKLGGDKLSGEVYERIRKSVLEMRSAPSMRLLAMAGPAADRQNVSIYNCSYLPVDSLDAFCEAMMISMSGCGVGFSVESKYVENLPRIKRQMNVLPLKMVVEDSTEGWIAAIRQGLSIWFEGGDIQFDYSQVRPAGALLKTKGGRASGPAPLRHALEFAKRRILVRQGSFLRSIDAHDIMCEVGNAAVAGGSRRTAMISLFDWDDEDMRNCKTGDFEKENSQRWNANNSAVWPDRGITQSELVHQMLDMVDGGRGEPGIFNRQAAINMRPARRKIADFGTNPCGEIILRPYQFCNLSITIARADDNYESLKDKIEVASIIGTLQSMATHFPGLRPIWKANCEEERLLGVDINGQMDCPAVQDPAVMNRLRQVAIETNREYAQKLGISQSVSVTCVKPSGNSSQLFNCASGLHARMARYYIRNVRVSAHTPIFQVMKDGGMPMDPENGQTAETAHTWVAHFPIKSPDGAVIREGRGAIEQCEYWLKNKIHWTEHNPSVTITYKPHEIIGLIDWVWNHKDMVGGMAFLPAFEANYAQMPYQEISEEEYEDLASKFPNIDFSKLYRYEEEDYTKAAQELACVAGSCEIEVVPTGNNGDTIEAVGMS